ncbi:putative MFS family arabinose efflux permease [Streptomyces sp. Ag109_G2-6]|uniref:MFS transporter n=1 Tax=Streptomyces sp. Ag109_G2-6 TaxID=2485154 RepID=UPI000F4E7568|nr:MFS transporter [Streptomyces sp. Ag109_G2-6]RPF41112.1 putative MFS family arabinose efflux permease [Streptomyces sp. Ag109_G2-6]
MTQMKKPAIPEPLKDSRFRLLWLGQTVSFIGNSIFPVSLTLALIKETGSAADLGLVLATEALAAGIFLLLGGVWADRLPRQRVMMVADCVQCVANSVIGIELALGTADLTHIIICAALVGASSGFFLPASSGILPAVVAPERLREANALMAVSRRTAMLIGPGLATTLALTVGTGWALILNAVTFAVSVATLTCLHIRHIPMERARFIADLREGWQEVIGRTWLWSNLAVHGLWNLSRTVYFTVGAATVITSLGGEVAWGIIAQGATIGAFAGALISMRLQPRRPLVVSNICLALGALPLICIAAGASTWLTAAAAAAMTVSVGLMGTLWDTTVQEQVPNNKLSRVSSYDWLLSTALSPLGMALAGPLALVVGATPILYGAAAVMASSALGVLALRQVRDISPKSPTPDTSTDDRHTANSS